MASSQHRPPSFVIAISGTAGAGKTTLVRQVAQLLGDATTLCFDDYRSVAKYPQFPEGMAKWIEAGRDLDAWEIPQLLDDLRALRSGRRITLPDDKGDVEPARFVVLEEPSGRERNGMAALVDVVVLVDLPLEIALARKVVADLEYCLEQVPLDELPRVIEKMICYYAHYPLARAYYLTCIERVRRNCELVVDGTRPTDELAQEIVTAAKKWETSLRSAEPVDSDTLAVD